MLIDFKDVNNPSIISYIDATQERSDEHLTSFDGKYIFLMTFTKLKVIPMKSKIKMNISIFEKTIQKGIQNLKFIEKG